MPPGAFNRRRFLAALSASVALLAVPEGLDGQQATATDAYTRHTLEAFADTLVPGQRRDSNDRAIAGVVTGPGAVQAGAMDLLGSPQLPVAPLLPGLAALLNTRAVAYAASHAILLPLGWPPFVALSFPDRTKIVRDATAPTEADRAIWQLLAFLIALAFDCAAYQSTGQALASTHPGLAWLRFPAPDPDGFWRYPAHSYDQPLAQIHPDTTPSGSPA